MTHLAKTITRVPRVISPTPSLLKSKEQQLITIEFAPNIHKGESQYTYKHPQFVFGDRVRAQQQNQTNNFTVCGMELVESKTPSGELIDQPYWKYKVSDGQQTFWFDESALTRVTTTTCVECPNFQDFHEPNGRGWCNLFDHMAKQHHQRTNDCDSTFSLYPENLEFPEEDLPHSEFEAESIVKVIDSEEHHSEWATFIVVAKKLNIELYRSTESYLTEPQWYYQLAAIPYESTYQTFWVSETDICHFDQSHLIETSSDVF